METSNAGVLRRVMAERILLLDGAMGTMIQQARLTEADFRGTRFVGWPVELSGDNDVLVLSAPEVVAGIHRQYLEAGADVIETCTFNAQRISQHEYRMEGFVSEMNFQAACLARREADRMTYLTPDRPRFVAGSVGPTNKMLSMSADVDDPAARAVTFDELEAVYFEQMFALVRGGVDALLIETIFDTLNAKAALCAARRAMDAAGREVEIMLSLTVSDASGRTLSGQTVEAFVVSVAHAPLLSIGLNCSLGASGLLPYLRRLSAVAPCYVTAHPNAGLPNRFGGYDDTPADMCSRMESYLKERLVNMIGGCCGTTPEHIAEMRRLLTGGDALTKNRRTVFAPGGGGWLSGLEPVDMGMAFFNVGERCNVSGSRKFLRLIHEKKYDEALCIARRQVEDGAMALDVNMDDGLLDAVAEMRTFLNLLASDPAVCRVPVMVDSSRFEVIEAGLKCVQGKCIVNSISLKEGEARFLERARIVRRLGAAVIVMAFDERGQATDYARRIEICSRAYRLLTERAGFVPSDIIFDPNILTVATGIAEHGNYALDFIRAARWIHENLPGCHISGGLSNLSFAFRGHNYLREAMHAVFLYHAVRAGMDMAIMNPAAAVAYEDIAVDLRQAIEDVLLNRDDEAAERLMCEAMRLRRAQEAAPLPESGSRILATAEPESSRLSVDERLVRMLVQGNPSGLEDEFAEALSVFDTPLQIISGPLMEGMNTVGRLFGEGKMFLPQVVKTARTMKRAVEILRPRMEAFLRATAESRDGETRLGEKEIHYSGRILIATVKGDVHDIGKNIVGVILSCNNFEVIDLGVMVPAETIVETAIARKADIVCLSGLITPSLEEMCRVAEAMQRAGLRIPLMVGGATTSAVHTAVKIAPLYAGPVFHVCDAAQNPVLASKWMDPACREELVAELKREQERLRCEQMEKTGLARRAVEASASPLSRRLRIDWSGYMPPVPPFFGRRLHAPLSVRGLLRKIDWSFFFHAWKVKEGAPEALALREEATGILEEIADDERFSLRATTAFYPAAGGEEGIEVKLADPAASVPENDVASLFLPTPRQQRPGEETCLSLCDYVAPRGDCIGAFAITVSACFISKLEALKQGGDDYVTMLWQTLGDRLVEAASASLYEELSAGGHWGGIRPAVGYPVLPDQKAIFLLAKLVDFESVGIRLTENGAMYPQASVAGLYIAYRKAKYFTI